MYIQGLCKGLYKGIYPHNMAVDGTVPLFIPIDFYAEKMRIHPTGMKLSQQELMVT